MKKKGINEDEKKTNWNKRKSETKLTYIRETTSVKKPRIERSHKNQDLKRKEEKMKEKGINENEKEN